MAWGLDDDSIPSDLAHDKRFYTFNQFIKLGQTIQDTVIQRIVDNIRPNQCCCLIYTSGTTGNPKGVMLTHDNMIISGATTWANAIGYLRPGYNQELQNTRLVSYLPLSHIAGLIFDVMNLSLLGGQLYFARPDAL